MALGFGLPSIFVVYTLSMQLKPFLTWRTTVVRLRECLCRLEKAQWEVVVVVVVERETWRMERRDAD